MSDTVPPHDPAEAPPEGRIPWLAAVAAAAAVAYLGFHVFVLTAWPMAPLLFRGWHVGGIVVIACLLWLSDGTRWRETGALVLLGAGGLAATLYLTLHVNQIEMRAGVLPTTFDVVFATVLILTVLEITRRAAGLPIVLLCVAFICYALWGNYLPQPFTHAGYSYPRMSTFLFTTNGIFGIPVGSSATFIYFFIIFGTLLSMSGAADFMMRLALRLSGRARGGPAKVGVVASGFFGMINGTSAGNVAATGAITIPMMKRSGFRPEFAGAVEAVASSGGQILPPVMGAAAFLMIEMTGIPYSQIILSAAVPAALYFLSVFLMVHFEAVRKNIGSGTGMAIPTLRELLRECYYVLPLVVLIVSLLGFGSSIIRAALLSLATTMLISLVRRATAIGPRRIVEASVAGARGTVSIAATCAAAGIVIGVLNLTGLGVKLASIILSLTDGVLWATLVVTMIVTIVLGMGMPTVAAYAITGTVVAPALIRLGVEPMAAHLFILFFASLSAITPPVALASYAAAAVAQAKVTELSLLAVRLGLAGFVIPFIFVYHPGLLLIGSWDEIALAMLAGVGSVVLMSTAIQFRSRNTFIRVAFAASALLFILPSPMTTGLAVLAGLCTLMMQAGPGWRRRRQTFADRGSAE